MICDGGYERRWEGSVMGRKDGENILECNVKQHCGMWVYGFGFALRGWHFTVTYLVYILGAPMRMLLCLGAGGKR